MVGVQAFQNAVPMVYVVVEVDGSDVQIVPDIETRSAAELFTIAQAEAVRCEVPIEDVSLRFTAEREAQGQSAAVKPLTGPV